MATSGFLDLTKKGNILWQKTYGGVGCDRAYSINDQVQGVGINLNNFLCEEELSKQLPQIPSCENDEGITRNRSHFPEHPELFQPMPIPDPTKKLHEPSNDNPEVPESHIIKNGKALSSEKVNE